MWRWINSPTYLGEILDRREGGPLTRRAASAAVFGPQ
jgi:hypothetical protein